MHSAFFYDDYSFNNDDISNYQFCYKPSFIEENNDSENFINSCSDINTFIKKNTLSFYTTNEEKTPIDFDLNNKSEIALNCEQQNTISEDIMKLNEIQNGFNCEKIKEILKNSTISNNIEQIFAPDSQLIKIDKEINNFSLIKRKKRRKKGKIKFTENKQMIRGRKRRKDLSHRKHNKYSGDNIIKKAKIKFLDCALLFVNNILRLNIDINKLIEYNQLLRSNKKEDCEIENLIKPIDYKLIDTIKKERDLLLLKQSLKEIFSNDISSKYSTLPKNSNRTMIERIIKDYSNNANIMFAFNFTFGDWIDVFLYKKKLNSIKDYDEEKMKEIEDKFNKIDKLILELKNIHDDNYLSYFIFYAFNYKRWFLLKNGRNRVSKEIIKK